jgi:hypothetical protein
MTTYPTRHQTKTTKSTPDAKRTLPAKLDGDKAEGFVTGRNQRKVSSAEQIWRKRGELGLGEDAIRIQLHEPSEFFGRKTTV